jgi:uncharacterized membrane protein
MHGLLMILLAAVVWGVGDIFSKLAVETTSPWLTSLVRSATFFPIVAACVLRQGRPRVRADRATVAAAGAGTLVGVAIVAARFALEHYDVSIVSPIRRLSLLVTVVLSVLVLDETLTTRKAAGIVTALVAALLLAP